MRDRWLRRVWGVIRFRAPKLVEPGLYTKASHWKPIIPWPQHKPSQNFFERTSVPHEGLPALGFNAMSILGDLGSLGIVSE